ncbi:tRNA pseudouridine(55) synthase TruB [Allohahella marinimesophila]|uniref:tRNA pseudouridine synthase B n=1 Tax=Allohahella marinimesophila TaxID=1054972 RepID=A0ABP7Q175_9GAMM
MKALDGVLCIDKPFGLSSNAALQRVKRFIGASKAGHTGTLDPMATGLLPICLGDATKFSRFFLDADKTYLTVVRLGQTTSTGDREGDILQEKPVPPEFDQAQLNDVISRFVGRIEQVPPMYSALKHKGQPLYKLARQGKSVDRPARSIVIRSLEIVSHESPYLTLKVSCSKGTYIRTLAEDIGQELGFGAHLESLRRTASGPFSLEDAYELPDRFEPGLDSAGDRIERAPELLQAEAATLVAAIRPVDAALEHLPRLELDDAAARSLIVGREVIIRDPGLGLGLSAIKPQDLADASLPEKPLYRAYGLGCFLGLVHPSEEAAGHAGHPRLRLEICKLVNTGAIVANLQ